MKSLTQLLLLSASFAIATDAWSIPLSTIGGPDTLLAQTSLRNSGAATEVKWIEGVLGLSLTGFDYQQTSVSAGDWESVDDNDGLFAFELAGPADWFLIKIGNNSGSPSTHFLFDNTFNPYFAVIDLIDMGFSRKNIANIGKISHIAAGPDQPRTVPEIGSLALMSLGLVGFAVLRRRARLAIR